MTMKIDTYHACDFQAIRDGVASSRKAYGLPLRTRSTQGLIT